MYDVIIVGARIAGAATAALLARQGCRVLLVDRAPVPSPAVSTHFFAKTALEFLDRELRVLPEVLATGAPALRRWHIEIEGACYGGPMLSRSPYSYNLCVRREALDGILLRAALRERSVDMRTRTRVTRLLRGSGADSGKVTGVAGDGWEERAPVVIGADGRHSLVARLAGARKEFDAGVLRGTSHAYWTGVAPHPEPALELWYDGHDILQVGPCDAGMWVIMVSSPARHGTSSPAADTAGYTERLRRIPAMNARLRDASLASPVFVSRTIGNFERAAGGPGWFLAGDAYCLKDPLFGAGITDAFRAAQALSRVVPLALGGSPDWAALAERYRDEVHGSIGQRVKEGLDGLRVEPIPDEQRAWIRGVLSHPAFALELSRNCAQLFSALPEDRQDFWARAAADVAAVDGLPAPAKLPGPTGPVRSIA